MAPITASRGAAQAEAGGTALLKAPANLLLIELPIGTATGPVSLGGGGLAGVGGGQARVQKPLIAIPLLAALIFPSRLVAELHPS